MSKTYDFSKFAKDATPYPHVAGQWQVVDERKGVQLLYGKSPNGDTWAVVSGGANVRTFKYGEHAEAYFKMLTRG